MSVKIPCILFMFSRSRAHKGEGRRGFLSTALHSLSHVLTAAHIYYRSRYSCKHSRVSNICAEMLTRHTHTHTLPAHSTLRTFCIQHAPHRSLSAHAPLCSPCETRHSAGAALSTTSRGSSADVGLGESTASADAPAVPTASPARRRGRRARAIHASGFLIMALSTSL